MNALTGLGCPQRVSSCIVTCGDYRHWDRQRNCKGPLFLPWRIGFVSHEKLQHQGEGVCSLVPDPRDLPPSRIGFVWCGSPVCSDAARRFRRRGEPRLPVRNPEIGFVWRNRRPQPSTAHHLRPMGFVHLKLDTSNLKPSQFGLFVQLPCPHPTRSGRKLALSCRGLLLA
jgi:hypothetical protein